MAGSWTEIQLGGHPCDLFQPGQPNPHGFAVLYLHGVHQQRLRDHLPFTSRLDRHGLPCIAPQTGRSWWTDRICREFDPHVSAERHLLDRVLPWLDSHWQVQPPRLALLGTSMGGQGALRLAYKYPQRFPVVAALSPAIDYQMRFHDPDSAVATMYPDPEAVRQDTALLHIHPLNWPRHQFFACDPSDTRWWDSADRLRMKLWSLGIPFDCDLETTGGGHGFEYYNRLAGKAIDFLADRLERDRRERTAREDVSRDGNTVVTGQSEPETSAPSRREIS
ncbi:MAG: alpha/beta hydrolase-fold protein [Pirellulales bacterium]